MEEKILAQFLQMKRELTKMNIQQRKTNKILKKLLETSVKQLERQKKLNQKICFFPI